MSIDAISPAYLPLFEIPTPPPSETTAPAEVPASKEFTFKIGGTVDTGSDFTRMIKAASAGDIVAKREIERLEGNSGCCGSC